MATIKKYRFTFKLGGWDREMADALGEQADRMRRFGDKPKKHQVTVRAKDEDSAWEQYEEYISALVGSHFNPSYDSDNVVCHEEEYSYELRPDGGFGSLLRSRRWALVK